LFLGSNKYIIINDISEIYKLDTRFARFYFTVLYSYIFCSFFIRFIIYSLKMQGCTSGND